MRSESGFTPLHFAVSGSKGEVGEPSVPRLYFPFPGLAQQSDRGFTTDRWYQLRVVSLRHITYLEVCRCFACKMMEGVCEPATA